MIPEKRYAIGCLLGSSKPSQHKSEFAVVSFPSFSNRFKRSASLRAGSEIVQGRHYTWGMGHVECNPAAPLETKGNMATTRIC